MRSKNDRLTDEMTQLRISLSATRAENVRLQRALDAHPAEGATIGTAYINVKPSLDEELTAQLVHEDAIVFSPEVKTAVLAVALRLEERADKRTLPNGASLCIVEELYERSGTLKELLGDITEQDEEHAQALLQELLGSR